jgi:hypothetical protein
MSNNPLKDVFNTPEPTSGETFTNLKTIHRVGIKGQEHVIREESTQPLKDGTFEDIHTVNVHTDRAGQPIPEDPSKYTISHSGIFTTPENSAICNSWFHFGGSRTIAVGYDGYKREENAICFPCYYWQLTFRAAALILLLGGLIGVITGILSF